MSILRLLVQHGIWNEDDCKVFKCVLATCKSMKQYVCQNKSLGKRLLNALLVCKQIFINEILREQYFELDRIIHGERKIWHPNGILFYRGFYVNGKAHGEFKYWTENGKPFLRACYANGKEVYVKKDDNKCEKAHGKFTYWMDNGDPFLSNK